MLFNQLKRKFKVFRGIVTKYIKIYQTSISNAVLLDAKFSEKIIFAEGCRV